MIEVKFSAELTASIEIPDLEFNYLYRFCATHYDSRVQEAANIGEFLYGTKNRREFSNGEDKCIDVTFRQCDLLLKSLEMDKGAMKQFLSSCFIRVLMHIDELHPKVATVLESEKLTFTNE